MDTFLNYLSTIKNESQNLSSTNDIHIVLGNESCDLDSMVSTLIFAFFLQIYPSNIMSKNSLVIPIQNVPYEDFLLRSDNCYLLEKAKIPLETLVYKNDINLTELVNSKKLTCTLVDHHVPSGNDKILMSTIRQIIDHRPVDPDANWPEHVIKIRIEQVGSCTTLICDEIYKTNPGFMFKELAFLIYQTMIYDTIYLEPEYGKAKELDLLIAKKLETEFNFGVDRKILYQSLWTVHNNVSHLTPQQLLKKDLKIVNNVPVPGLPMLVKDFLKIPKAFEAVQKFACERQVPIIVLIGLDTKDDVKRDVGIYYREHGGELKDLLLNNLKNSESLKGYDFDFTEVETGFTNVICLRQGNVKLSRKQIVPLIKSVPL